MGAFRWLDFFGKKRSYQEISEERGIHVKTLKRANSVIASTSEILLEMARTRLNPMFQRDGLVPEAGHLGTHRQLTTLY